MKVVCPSCGSGYDLDVSLMRKKVQCGECQHKFRAIPHFIIEIINHNGKTTVSELYNQIKSEYKKIKKIADTCSDFDNFIIHKTDDPSYDFSNGIKINIGECLANMCGASEEMIGYVEGLIDDRKEFFRDWSYSCPFHKRPTKEQYDKLVDYLDKKYGFEWAAGDEECRMIDAVDKMFPELNK